LVSLSFDAWKPGATEPAIVTVPVHLIEAVESAQLKATFKGHEGTVGKVAWSPDGRTLAALSYSDGVKLWDVTARKERATLRSDLGVSYHLEFAPDGNKLYVSHVKYDPKIGRTGGISIWDTASGQRVGLLQNSAPRGVTQFALSPDGKTILAREIWTEREGEQVINKIGLTHWELATGKPRATNFDDQNGNGLTLSPDGKVLAVATYTIKGNQIDRVEIRRHDLTTQKDLPALTNPSSKSPPSGLVFSPDGQTLAATDYLGEIYLWSTETGKLRATIKSENSRRISSLAFSPDGKTLAAGIADAPGRDHEPGLIILFDAGSGQRRLVLSGHTNAVQSVAFSLDGKLLASGSLDRTVRLWDLATVTTGAPSGE
jgi:WD40 repeat protein